MRTRDLSANNINTLDSRGVFGSANNATCILCLDNAFVCIQSLHLSRGFCTLVLFIDEVEGAATRVVCDLEMIFHESFDVVAVSGHYSESIDCRAESREHHMTTGTCTKAESHTHSLCLRLH